MSLAERLRTALEQPPREPLLPGDDGPATVGTVPAAVLIAVTDQPEPGVVLTLRRPDMRTHAGQIAFPGGRIDPGEEPAAAALREAWEELGLEPAAVTPISVLDPYRTITGYHVTPLLGVIPPGLPLAPHEAEVADWFEAPLDFVLDPANQQREGVMFEGRQRHYFQINWQGRRIWGATAAMLVNLARRLQWR